MRGKGTIETGKTNSVLPIFISNDNKCKDRQTDFK